MVAGKTLGVILRNDECPVMEGEIRQCWPDEIVTLAIMYYVHQEQLASTGVRKDAFEDSLLATLASVRE